jgi:hypothetical protein
MLYCTCALSLLRACAPGVDVGLHANTPLGVCWQSTFPTHPHTHTHTHSHATPPHCTVHHRVQWGVHVRNDGQELCCHCRRHSPRHPGACIPPCLCPRHCLPCLVWNATDGGQSKPPLSSQPQSPCILHLSLATSAMKGGAFACAVCSWAVLHLRSRSAAQTAPSMPLVHFTQRTVHSPCCTGVQHTVMSIHHLLCAHTRYPRSNARSSHWHGTQAQTVSCDFQKIFRMGKRLMVGLPGLATDVLTV